MRLAKSVLTTATTRTRRTRTNPWRWYLNAVFLVIHGGRVLLPLSGGCSSSSSQKHGVARGPGVGYTRYWSKATLAHQRRSLARFVPPPRGRRRLSLYRLPPPDAAPPQWLSISVRPWCAADDSLFVASGYLPPATTSYTKLILSFELCWTPARLVYIFLEE